MAIATPSVLVLRAPLSGRLVPLEAVPDAVFAQRIAGDGVAIDPTSQTLLAPCAGLVAHVHATGHALALRTPEGVEVMMHVGLDTVALAGEGFRVLVHEGQHVREGAPLVEFDAGAVAARVRSLLTTVLVTTPARVARIVVRSGIVEAGRDAIAEVTLREAVPETDALAEHVSPPVLVRMPGGLHARPAAVLARAARAFPSAVYLQRGTAVADARSVLALMGLDVGYLDAVRVAAAGPGSANAVSRLAALIEEGLGEVIDDRAAADDLSGRLTSTEPGSRHEPPGRVLRGAGASPGLAVGHVFHASRAAPAVAEHAADPRAERRALERAIDVATDQLRELQSRLGSDRSGIFAAHEALLSDPALLEAAAAEIAHGRSAALGWQRAVERHAGHLERLGHARIAARAADLRDVGERVQRLLAHAGGLRPPPPGASVLVAEDLAPSEVAALDRSRVVGVCTTRGSVTSHAAILARALSLPAVVALHPDVLELPDGTPVLLDGASGTLLVAPGEADVARAGERQVRQLARLAGWRARAHEPAVTRDGLRVEVTANIGSAAESAAVGEEGGEGVGLLRSEFLFLDRERPPSESEQAEAFAAIAGVLGPGRPLVVRALDAGGDKPLACVSMPQEANPALGERGLRLLLDRPDLLRAQLGAVLRASARGALRVLFPMVTRLDEWRTVRAMLEEEARRLGVPPVPAGLMVEVPSAALLAGAFAAEAAFLSIGTNDLAQYTLAIDRGHAALAAGADGLDPAVLRLVDHTVQAAQRHGTPVSVCGDIAADPQAIPILVGLGVRSLSVAVPAIAAVKARVRELDAGACRALAHRALEAVTACDVRALVVVEDV